MYNWQKQLTLFVTICSSAKVIFFRNALPATAAFLHDFPVLQEWSLATVPLVVELLRSTSSRSLAFLKESGKRKLKSTMKWYPNFCVTIVDFFREFYKLTLNAFFSGNPDRIYKRNRRSSEIFCKVWNSFGGHGFRGPLCSHCTCVSLLSLRNQPLDRIKLSPFYHMYHFRHSTVLQPGLVHSKDQLCWKAFCSNRILHWELFRNQRLSITITIAGHHVDKR